MTEEQIMMDIKILETISDVLLIVDKKSTIIGASNSIEDLFCYTKKEILGEKLEMLIPVRFRKNHEIMFSRFAADPSPRRMGSGRDLRALDKNGNEFDIDIALSSFKENKEMRYVAIIRDISDIRDLQRKLTHNNEDLQAKNKELEHFAYIVSHDLKAPSRHVRQLVEMIEEDHGDELSEDVLEYFSLIKHRSRRMGELIDGILSYSRAGRTDDHISTFPLSDLFKDVLETIHIPEGFEIEFPDKSCTIQSNRTQLGQVFSNLIGNAVKYHDKEQGKITVSCNEIVDFFEFAVTDDGPGIAEEHHETIFTMFGTANQTSRTDSTGIGLAIVKKIIEHHQGVITLVSQPGEGSTFKFTWKKSR